MPQAGKDGVLWKDLGVANQGLENRGRFLNRDMTKKQQQHFKGIIQVKKLGWGREVNS